MKRTVFFIPHPSAFILCLAPPRRLNRGTAPRSHAQEEEIPHAIPVATAAQADNGTTVIAIGCCDAWLLLVNGGGLCRFR